MNRQAFKQRMQSLKSYRENNPGKGYWDWKIESFQSGGEKGQNIVNGIRVNPYTGQPISTGQITPILDLRTAADFTPVGDALAINDAVQAIRNRDWLGASLAGLGVVPFVPRVNRTVQDRMERMFKQDAKRKQTVNEFYRQRNNSYEDIIENEDAYRRAVNADRKYGTNYKTVYQQMLENYYRDSSNQNPSLTRMVFDPNLYGTNTKGQVNPNNLGTITINPRYYDIDELDQNFQQLNEGLVRHELGHKVDVRSGLDYTNTLANPDNFVSDDKLKEMFPKTYKSLKNNVLNRGSEIKSYMNEFRDFLHSKGDYGLDETVNSFTRKLDQYSNEFPTLRKIFDSYKSKKKFIKDYNTVPIVSTGTNTNLV